MLHTCMAEMGDSYFGSNRYRPCVKPAKGVRDIPPILVCGVHQRLEHVRRSWKATLDIEAVPALLLPDLLRLQRDYARLCWERTEQVRQSAVRADEEAGKIEDRLLAAAQVKTEPPRATRREGVSDE
jgi:hypothetical protein